jgi:hypothetical protein
MISYALAALLGGLVGLSELMNRYRDAPFSALRNWATVLFAAINVFASVATLAVIQGTDLVKLPPSIGAEAQAAAQIVVAGIGAMALLRVGISVQFSSETVSISLATLLRPLLRAADNEVDRARASHKLAVARELMFTLDASKALEELPPLCLSLMRSVSDEEEKELADYVKGLRQENLRDELKLINLGAALLNIVGENVLRNAVKAFKEIEDHGQGRDTVSQATVVAENLPRL